MKVVLSMEKRKKKIVKVTRSVYVTHDYWDKAADYCYLDGLSVSELIDGFLKDYVYKKENQENK